MAPSKNKTVFLIDSDVTKSCTTRRLVVRQIVACLQKVTSVDKSVLNHCQVPDFRVAMLNLLYTYIRKCLTRKV